MVYRNPIIPGFHPDPSICRAGDDYYLVTSSFEFFPGVPVFHSRDLVSWTQVGHCLTRKSQLPLDNCPSSAGIYAPTIRHHAGRFYMVTTNVSSGGNFYVTTDDPAGEWSEPVWVDQRGIDPSLLFDDDGKVYFASNDSKHHPGIRGAFQTQIDISTGKLIGQTTHLWAGTGGAHPEGPHVYKHNGWYYLLMSEGGTEFGHMITMARSRNINGPYEPCPRNPVFTHRSLNERLQSTGHADLLQDAQGRWWIVFLACRHVGYPKMHHLGRETCIAPVDWDADGWPVVNGGRPVALEVQTDRITAAQKLPAGRKDDFDAPRLSLEWNFRRNLPDSAWSLRQRPSHLTLHCIAPTLSDSTAHAFVGRRQEHLTCTASTLLDFAPQNPADEAGLTVFMNEQYRCDLAVTEREGKRVAILRRCIGSLTAEAARAEIPNGPVTLHVRAEPDWYHFSIQPQNQPAIELGKVETRHLSTELAGGFTGVYLAMYATGNGTDSQAQAHFDWFDYAGAEERPKR